MNTAFTTSDVARSTDFAQKLINNNALPGYKVPGSSTPSVTAQSLGNCLWQYKVPMTRFEEIYYKHVLILSPVAFDLEPLWRSDCTITLVKDVFEAGAYLGGIRPRVIYIHSLLYKLQASSFRAGRFGDCPIIGFTYHTEVAGRLDADLHR